MEEETVPFGSVIEDITRGIRIKAADLEKMITYDTTDIKYMNLKNMEDGHLTGEMPNLKELEEKYKKYCIETGNLVITKTGYPPKIMVAEIPEGLHILVSWIFYIIEVNRQKADSNYLAAYMNSPKGRLSLADISMGDVIPTISITELKNMKIPLPPMETQKKIGQEYKELVEEIKKLKAKLETAREQLDNII